MSRPRSLSEVILFSNHRFLRSFKSCDELWKLVNFYNGLGYEVVARNAQIAILDNNIYRIEIRRLD